MACLQRMIIAAIAIAVLGQLTIGSASASSSDPGQAHSAKRRVYCTPHRHPRGCIRVPRSAVRPQHINQQGSHALIPTDVENGGGLGGGPGLHRDTALRWAESQRGLKLWAWRCERFVEEAYGTRSRFSTAILAARHMSLHDGDVTSAPPGTLVYFAADKYNNGWGHVGISLGHGKVISALTRVEITDVAESTYWRRLYLGWAEAPADWPGRIPPPPGATTPDPTLGVRITAPAAGSEQSGVVSLLASATGATGVVFDSYYATDPRDPTTRGWHELGVARQTGDAWELDWDTLGVPDQGLAAWGTVNVAATALDAFGRRTGTRDYRRLSIHNTTGPPPPAEPAAGTVGIDGDTLHYQASPGKFNELYIMLQGGEFTIQDGTSGNRDTLPVTARPPCRHDDTAGPYPGLNDAYCPAQGVEDIRAELGDGNDTVSIGGMTSTDYPATIDGGEGADRIFAGPQADVVDGGSGNDTITGNAGGDFLSGDEGDDVINATDGVPDRVSCGPGYDSVTADIVDTVSDDCELINIGPGQPQQVIINEVSPPSLDTLPVRGLRARLTCAAACSARSELLLPAPRTDGSSTLARAADSRLLATGRARRGSAGSLTIVTRLQHGAARRLRVLRPSRLAFRTTVQLGASTTVLQRFVRVRRAR